MKINLAFLLKVSLEMASIKKIEKIKNELSYLHKNIENLF